MSLIQFPDSRAGGGNGGSSDERLRALEGDVREIKTTLKKLDDFPTKAEITNEIYKLKIWATMGALIGSIAIIGWLVKMLLKASGNG